MIQSIRNPFLRRAALVFTVIAGIVCVGPLHIAAAIWRWFEREFDTDLRAVWRGDQQ